MARKKQEDPPKGSPAWMATFSDLMNLLLCFFVLLFSMSSVNEEKFELVIASLQSSFSVLPSGGAAVGDGQMVSSGISQLKEFDVYYNEGSNSDGKEDSKGGVTEDENEMTAQEQVKQEQLSESEKMAEQVEKEAKQYGIQDQVEVDFNGQYVLVTLNGALLFESGSAEIRAEAMPLMEKIGKILEKYQDNIIEIEGHTDNVPIHNSNFASNEALSLYRAMSVTDYIREQTSIEPSRLKAAGRGEYVPIADNNTPEGRARNRRVEIKIYNKSYSELNEPDTADKKQ
ncbi:MAG: flagellar motor protein MotB [Lachnospiraceae bacterium]